MLLLGIIAGFLLSYIFQDVLGAVKILFYVFLFALLADVLLLFASKGRLIGQRILPDKLSNGDENPITITISNGFLFQTTLKIIDELPFQFQKRDFELTSQLKPGEQKSYGYELRPTERGSYSFGGLNVFASSPLGLLGRRFQFDQEAEIPVYPSFLQLKKYDLIAFSNRLFEYGLKKIRRIGHTMEFEQIKEYVQGDDIRKHQLESDC